MIRRPDTGILVERPEPDAGGSPSRSGQSAEPQFEQKTLAEPSGGWKALSSSAPAVTFSEPGTMRAFAEAAAVRAARQRVQWQ